MPFDCVGVTMHIKGRVLEIYCRVCQYKDDRYDLKVKRNKKQVKQLKKFLQIRFLNSLS